MRYDNYGRQSEVVLTDKSSYTHPHTSSSIVYQRTRQFEFNSQERRNDLYAQETERIG